MSSDRDTKHKQSQALIVDRQLGWRSVKKMTDRQQKKLGKRFATQTLLDRNLCRLGRSFLVLKADGTAGSSQANRRKLSEACRHELCALSSSLVLTRSKHKRAALRKWSIAASSWRDGTKLCWSGKGGN